MWERQVGVDICVKGCKRIYVGTCMGSSSGRTGMRVGEVSTVWGKYRTGEAGGGRLHLRTG